MVGALPCSLPAPGWPAPALSSMSLICSHPAAHWLRSLSASRFTHSWAEASQEAWSSRNMRLPLFLSCITCSAVQVRRGGQLLPRTCVGACNCDPFISSCPASLMFISARDYSSQRSVISAVDRPTSKCRHPRVSSMAVHLVPVPWCRARAGSMEASAMVLSKHVHAFQNMRPHQAIPRTSFGTTFFLL